MRSPSSILAVKCGICLAVILPSHGFSQPGDQALRSLTYEAIALHRSHEDDAENLFKNGDFEDGLGGWNVQSWGKKGQADVDTGERYNQHPSLRISNGTADNTFVTQLVRVTPSRRYRLSCWVKTRDISVKQGRGNAGATLWIAGGWEATKVVKHAEDWTRLEMVFDSGKRTEIQVGPRLGQWGGILTGTAWFSDVSLVDLGPSRN